VIALGVDDQAFEYALDLALDLRQQCVEFPRFDEIGDVVVGMEAPFRPHQACPNARGHRGQRIARRGYWPFVHGRRNPFK
jgi:hypothetical protein